MQSCHILSHWPPFCHGIGRLSVFNAAVVADADDQTTDRLERSDLRKLPIIYPPEFAMPHGDDEAGAQISLPGFEPVIEGKR